MVNRTENMPLHFMSREQLYTLVHELNNIIDEHNKGCIAGLYIQPDFRELAKTVFPEDQDEPFRNIVLEAQQKIWTLVATRYDFAISGAMRWEWSQEAPIAYKSTFTVRAY